MRFLALLRHLAVCASVLSLAGAAQAEVINGYNSAVNDRFTPGTFPGNTPPSVNAGFLLAGYDLSGVGWVPGVNGAGTKQVTMISDENYIAATHFQLGLGTTVAFRAANGTYVTRTVQAETQIGGSDVLVGRLSSPVPTGVGGVTSYPLVVGPRSSFMGLTTYMFGQHGEVGTNILADWLFPNGPNTTENVGTGVTSMIQTDYDPNYNLDGLPISPYEFFSTPGDSGSPDLMIINGQLGLMGDHMSAYTDGSNVPAGTGETFLSDYQSLIAAQLLSDGRVLSTVAVPEPSSLVLIGLGSAWPVLRRLRRRAAA
ncbi:MAG: PEP-CTERM sorting domain-containing protein [Gemmataceae bacterium]